MKKGSGKRKTGGQPGHEGSTIERVSNPDHITPLLIDRRTLPKGKCYRRCEDEVRQVIEIAVSSEVTEYRAEVLVDEDGKRYVAEFPAEITRPVQHAPHAKRGKEAMDAIGILPSFGGIACHDHWKAYFQYKQCLHVLCNAHHLRELEWVVEQHGHQWASRMQKFR